MSRSVDELSGLPPPPRERRLGRSFSMKDGSFNGRGSLRDSKLRVRKLGKEGNSLLYIKSTRHGINLL